MIPSFCKTRNPRTIAGKKNGLLFTWRAALVIRRRAQDSSILELPPVGKRLVVAVAFAGGEVAIGLNMQGLMVHPSEWCIEHLLQLFFVND